MDRIRRVSRARLWWCGLLCVLSVAAAEAATRKYPAQPPAGDIIKYGSSGNTYFPNGAAAYVGQEYIDQHMAGNRFKAGDAPPSGSGSSQTQKVPVKSAVKVSPVKAAKAAAGIMRATVAGMAVMAAQAAVIWAVDQIPDFDSDGYKIQKKANVPVDCTSGGVSCWKASPLTQPFPSAESACQAWFGTKPTLTYTSTYIYNNATLAICYGKTSATSNPVGYGLAQKIGTCASPNVLDGGNCFTPAMTDLADADYQTLESALAQVTNSEWLRDLIKASCEGSLSPGRCYEDMVDQRKQLGPAMQMGPKSSTTTTTTGPDGMTSGTTTTTQNRYDYTYGDTFYDFTTTTTTQTTKDGQTTTTETTDAQPAGEEPAAEEPPPEEEPAPCSANCDGPAYVDQYTPTDKTKEQELDSYSSRFSNIPIMSAAGNFFAVSVSGGSCPVWSYQGQLQVYASSMPIDLEFDFHCLPWFIVLGPWIQAVMALGCTFIAIRIALL
ncbi:hypothetical protein [Pseudomonas sp. 2FE]|uniref:hypothetical protein n=1 Tax=Pseudomonas sp. 2FE TaxID=2502190 RepID=UPI0010F56BF5|nr:hypothetical protein [Pseudomonas sp. 2FE]